MSRPDAIGDLRSDRYTNGRIGYRHDATGIHPIGEDGWPLTDGEIRECDGEVWGAPMNFGWIGRR